MEISLGEYSLTIGAVITEVERPCGVDGLDDSEDEPKVTGAAGEPVS